MINFHMLDSDSSDDSVLFDLAPGKHGHFMRANGGASDDIDGIRMVVPLIEVGPKALFHIMGFIDDMEGTVTHTNITIVVRNPVDGVLAKIGVFAL